MLKAGIRLKEVRIEKGISLEDVSRNTKIKVAFLEYIENGEYSKLPSVSYAQGFVRNYARFLGMPDKEIMPIFKREYDSDKAYRVLPKGFESKSEFPLSGFRFRLRQTFFLIFAIFLIFISYIAYQYRYAFIDPPLKILLPKESVVRSTEVVVSGSTDPNSTVFVNKEVVTVSDNGRFIKSLNVFPGDFVIDVKAVNKFGRTTEVKKTINVKAAY
jgi:cytoskeletal protein RodZ